MRIATEWDIQRDESSAEDLVETIMGRDPYAVGNQYRNIGIIEHMFIHFESECCWMYVRDQHGNLWYIDVTEEVEW